MDVFDAFPNGIDLWEIGEANYSTLTGNQVIIDSAVDIHVIVDEAESTTPNQSPNAQGISDDTLLYCMPDELPTLNPAKLTASYMVRPKDSDKIYAIIEAGIGKNQETGIIEHVELKIRQSQAEGVTSGS